MNWIALRGFLVDGKPDAATKNFKEGLKVYPLAQAKDPPAMEFISGSKKAFNTIHANNAEFYDELAHVIANEPVDFIDPELRGLAASIGIRKDKPFAPDARMKAILVEAAAVANATARAIDFQTRDPVRLLLRQQPMEDGSGRWGLQLADRRRDRQQETCNTPAPASSIKRLSTHRQWCGRCRVSVLNTLIQRRMPVEIISTERRTTG